MFQKTLKALTILSLVLFIALQLYLRFGPSNDDEKVLAGSLETSRSESMVEKSDNAFDSNELPYREQISQIQKGCESRIEREISKEYIDSSYKKFKNYKDNLIKLEVLSEYILQQRNQAPYKDQKDITYEDLTLMGGICRVPRWDIYQENLIEASRSWPSSARKKLVSLMMLFFKETIAMRMNIEDALKINHFIEILSKENLLVETQEISHISSKFTERILQFQSLYKESSPEDRGRLIEEELEARESWHQEYVSEVERIIIQNRL